MNYKLMLRTLGRTLQLGALCLLLPLVVCLIYREDPKPFLYTIGLVGLLGSDELRFFLLAVALSSAIVFFNVLPLYESAGHALRDTLFQVSSVVSTTGFSTADFALWPTVSQFVLVLLMFLGGCAGSTAGGLKASRVLLLLRCARRSLRRLSHPRAVKVVKLDGKAVDEETLNTVFVFFTCFFQVLGGT